MASIAADNRYSRVKWGATKWGASAAAAVLDWELSVDWNGDGLFDNNEANRMVGLSGFRGRTNMLQPVGSGFEPVQTGRYTVTLDNYDGRFDPRNTASPLYPNVSYGKDVRIRVRDMSTGTTYPLFYGIITDIVSTGGIENPQAQLMLEDSWTYLRNNKARVAIQTGITTDTAVAAVLNAVSWPVRWGRNLDVNTDTLAYYWATGNNTAGEEIQNLTDSGAGAFFIAANGNATYRIRSDIPAATLDLGQSDVYREINPAQPWANFRNVIKLTVNPRVQAVSGVIWKLQGNAPSINAGQHLKFFASYTYNGTPAPANNVLQPVPTTDWTTNTLAGGGGTDKTAVCTLVITDFGDTALVDVFNGDAGLVYLTSAQIKGQAIYIQNSADVTYPADATTVQNPREFKQNLAWQQDINVAVTIAAVLGPFFGTTFPTIVCRTSGQPAKQFALDLWSTVSATFPKFGISGNSMRVTGIQHDSRIANCQDILTTLYLEPYPTVTGAAIWDTSVYDTGVYGW
jgi:hypothetical protein